MKGIEISYGAKDSELQEWEYNIPEGYTAEIKDGKVIIKKDKPKLTEFELHLLDWMSSDCNGKIPMEDMKRAVRFRAKELLELAKNEICKGCTVGLDQYWKGKEDARKEYEKYYTFHYPTYVSPCPHGGMCTNPFKDCVNCPRVQMPVPNIATTSGTCKKED